MPAHAFHDGADGLVSTQLPAPMVNNSPGSGEGTAEHPGTKPGVRQVEAGLQQAAHPGPGDQGVYAAQMLQPAGYPRRVTTETSRGGGVDEVVYGMVFGEQVDVPLARRQRAVAIEEIESVQGLCCGPGGGAVDLLGRQPDHIRRGADSVGEGLQDQERLGRAECPPLDERPLEPGEGRRRVPRLPGLVDERAQPVQPLLARERPDRRRLEVAVQRVSQVTRPVGEVAPELARAPMISEVPPRASRSSSSSWARSRISWRSAQSAGL